MAHDNVYTDLTQGNEQSELLNEQENETTMQSSYNRTYGNPNNMSRQTPPTPDPQDQDTFAEIMAANIGAYVLVQFLIGSTSLVDKEGYLYAVGMNFVTIYEPLDDRYVVCDLYSVKFVTIYNTPPISGSPRTGYQTNARNTRTYNQNSRRMY